MTNRIIASEYVGKRINDLTIISYSGDKQKSINFYCQCVCGNFKTINMYRVIYNRIKSCGCLRVRKAKTTKNYSSMHKVSAVEKRRLTNNQTTKSLKSNKSTGVRNIYFTKGRGYRVIIERNGRRYAAYTSTLEQAIIEKGKIIEQIKRDLGIVIKM